MAKEELVIKEGIVKESLPSAMFKVEFDDGSDALAVVSGKMRKFRIRILPGDKVKVEFTPYDLKLGRITYRS